MAASKSAEPNFFLDHPGWTGTFFAIVVAGAFLAAVFGTAPSAEERAHEKAEKEGANPTVSAHPAGAGSATGAPTSGNAASPR